MNEKDQNLHEQFSEYGRNAKEWMRKCVLLLPEIERQRIWEKKGFGSIYEYAAKLAGMSRYTVNEALRVLKSVEDKPELKKVIEDKGINCVKPIITVATPETQKFWANKARTMSKSETETYAREWRKQDGLPGKPKKVEIEMNLEPEIAQKLKKLKGSDDWNNLMKEFIEMRKKQFEQEKPEKVKTESRHIPIKIEKHVIKRSRGICEYPGCLKPYKILHHTCRFALYKEHDPDKIFALCKGHERLFHQGLVKNEHKPSDKWAIREFPDKKDPKFKIDQIVMRFRSGFT